MKELFLSWGMLILSVIFNAYGVFVIKLKLNQLGAVKFDSVKIVVSYFMELMKSPLTMSGIVFFVISPFLFGVSLSRMDIVTAYPAQIGLNFILVIILALLFLGESLTAYKMIGMALILIGIYLINKSG